VANSCADVERYLRRHFEPDDWVALLLKSCAGDASLQRTGSLAWAGRPRVLEWLLTQNTARFDVYVSVNALACGARSRARHDVAAIRHLFLDVDDDGPKVLREIERRPEIPAPSYVVHTSPGRVHVLWRVREFDMSLAERVQKRLAIDLAGDRAATSAAQLTRLPGFWNHKHGERYMVWVDHRDTEQVYMPHDFPPAHDAESGRPRSLATERSGAGHRSALARARAYLSGVPPAVAGNHGDLQTFQTCCRVVRGFALDDDQALAVLAEWNARCQPPWTERELLQKVRSARRNGREPFGGLL